ncbi:CbrC family protein [Vibrio owensii]|uniref:CbrC family protein n=1 Tax=Vibrio owensii TaxID=696485 RepID=UPI0018F1A126
MEFPVFKYHPDPIKTGSVVPTDESCDCCGLSMGYKGITELRAGEAVKSVCPWCIADGSAVTRFGGYFAGISPKSIDVVAADVVDEVCLRTPGFLSWRDDVWVACCGDVCEFHGDAERASLQELSGDALGRFLKVQCMGSEQWQGFLSVYQKGSYPAVYEFKCRVCKERLYSMDFA